MFNKKEKSFREKSEDVLSIFTTAIESLKGINEAISTENEIIDEKRRLLEEESAENTKVMEGNKTVLTNISNILTPN